MCRQSMRDTRRVSFSTSVTVNEIPSHLEYTSVEKDTIWHNEKDYAKIRRERLKCLVRYRSGYEDTSRYSFVGLEFMKSSEHYEQFTIIREGVIRGVLSEQEKVKLEGEKDSSAKVAEASEYLSTWSKIRAIERAQNLFKDLNTPAVRRKSSIDMMSIKYQGQQLVAELGRRDSI